MSSSSGFGINTENETGSGLSVGGQLSTSTSGVSSTCSGSLLQLSIGGGGSNESDTNGSVMEKGVMSIKGMVK